MIIVVNYKNVRRLYIDDFNIRRTDISVISLFAAFNRNRLAKMSSNSDRILRSSIENFFFISNFHPFISLHDLGEMTWIGQPALSLFRLAKSHAQSSSVNAVRN